MEKDLEKLQRIIDAGDNLDQVNTWGVGAVLDATRHSAPALKMLLDAGAEPHRVSNGGWNPLSVSVAWTNNEAINMLIDADTAVVGLEILFGILTVRDVSMQTQVLEALSNRRSRLRQFALWHLTDPKWKYLDLDIVRPLDSHALETVEALESLDVDIPGSLQLYGTGGRIRNKRPEPLFALAATKTTTYHLQPIVIKENQLVTFFDSLYSSGFHEVDAPNSEGLTPLQICCSKGHWEAAEWILKKLSPQAPSPMTGSGLNALHALAQYTADQYRTGGHKPEGWVKDLVKGLRDNGVQVAQGTNSSEDETIQFPCYCCPEGQTPTVTIAKDLASSRRVLTTSHQTQLFESIALRQTLAVWSEALGGDASALEAVYHSLTRQETFNRLELTHTCLDLRSIPLGKRPEPDFEEDEIREIRIEEEELGRQLDELMRSCDEGRAKYEGNGEEFYRDWIIGLPRYVREFGNDV
jgi:hypothetical protein